MGEEVPPEYGPMIAAELGLGEPPPAPEAGARGLPRDRRRRRHLRAGGRRSGWPRPASRTRSLERNATVGGTWLENRYPGAGVDTPSALYSFSFAQHDWSMYFALRDELHAYLERLADDFGVRERIRFDTEVPARGLRRGRAGVGRLATDGGTRRCAPTSLITARRRLQPAEVAGAPGPGATSRARSCTRRAGPTTST